MIDRKFDVIEIQVELAACDGQIQMQYWQDGILCKLEEMDLVTVWLVHRRYCILMSALTKSLPSGLSIVDVVAFSTKPWPRQRLTLTVPAGRANRQSRGSRNYYMPRARIELGLFHPIQSILQMKDIKGVIESGKCGEINGIRFGSEG